MNREQFTFLVRKELSGLRRFLLAACSGNDQEADDIAQEALLKAYTASADFEDESGFSRWLYRIACNCLSDHQRKDSVRAGTLSIEKAYSIFSFRRHLRLPGTVSRHRWLDAQRTNRRAALLHGRPSHQGNRYNHEHERRDGQSKPVERKITFKGKVKRLKEEL